MLVPADKNAAEVIIDNGIAVNLKCSDGLCGVCQCGLMSDEGEHRDFVLSKAQQKNTIILCQSRAAISEVLLELYLESRFIKSNHVKIRQNHYVHYFYSIILLLGV